MMIYRIAVQTELADVDLSILGGLERAAEAVLIRTGQQAGTGVAITLVDDGIIQSLNRDYRGVDAATDVLSFSTLEGDGFIVPAGQPLDLGDVLISLETAQRQASVMGHGLVDELALLVMHGCLHLTGHDHADARQQQEMWRLQDELLEGLGLTVRSYVPPDADGVEDD